MRFVKSKANTTWNCGKSYSFIRFAVDTVDGSQKFGEPAKVGTKNLINKQGVSIHLKCGDRRISSRFVVSNMFCFHLETWGRCPS